MQQNLKQKFSEEFFEEFQYDAEFRTLFESMVRGLTPYEAIEHLCKSKKELHRALGVVIENVPTKIIVTEKRMKELKEELIKHYCQGENCNIEIGEPKYCCNDFDCGCRGMPIDPPFCSLECIENFKKEDKSYLPFKED